MRTLDTEWVWSERERRTALTTTDVEAWTSIDFSWNICFGVVRVLEASIQGCGDVISWRSRITIVLHSAKPAWFTVVTCAKFHVLRNIWSVLNFKVLNIIRISYTFKLTFSLIILSSFLCVDEFCLICQKLYTVYFETCFGLVFCKLLQYCNWYSN